MQKRPSVGDVASAGVPDEGQQRRESRTLITSESQQFLGPGSVRFGLLPERSGSRRSHPATSPACSLPPSVSPRAFIHSYVRAKSTGS